MLSALFAFTLEPHITEFPQITLLPLSTELPHTTELPQITEVPFSKTLEPQITEFPQMTEELQIEEGSAWSTTLPNWPRTAVGDSAVPFAAL